VRFLVDASLSPTVVGSLRDAGHDAVHVGDILPLTAPDDIVFDAAVEQQRVIVTADTDFGEILARRQATIPSVVLFRAPGGRPSDRAQLLLDHLPDVAQELSDGAIVVFQETRLRVRPLPLGGSDAG
jgi:predicted nuclease of predicted toxin-antitoxin system